MEKNNYFPHLCKYNDMVVPRMEKESFKDV